MYLPVAFLMKDFLFLAASFYLIKQDLRRAALEEGAELSIAAWGRSRQNRLKPSLVIDERKEKLHDRDSLSDR